jgi:hypothetical protein
MKEQKNTYEYQTIRAIKRKLYLISLRGNSCEKCGYNKNIASLEFHHKDPKTKEIKLDQRKLSNSAMKVILNEFEKCTVLCSNCHREYHNPDLELCILKEKVNIFEDSKLKNIIIKKEPEYFCEDCGVSISKWGKKCKKCFYDSQKKEGRPNIETLLKELETSNIHKLSKKYDVCSKTIKKWLE